ncbi:MAG: hypothetical protein RLY70_3088 [Planctomycetota bacterium]
MQSGDGVGEVNRLETIGEAASGNRGGSDRSASRNPASDASAGAGAVSNTPASVLAGREDLAASQPFVGRWNKLISTTNWDKGRIIHDWRASLIASGSASTEYSDEIWSRLVGGVTPQHVGRLRRVYARFGERREQFPTLFWSHFFAAIEWEDAEMWLEGATRSRWSVSHMRRQRWEALGGPETDRPRDEEIVSSELNEDMPAVDDRDEPVRGKTTEIPAGPRHEGPDFGDEPSGATGGAAPFDSSEFGGADGSSEALADDSLVANAKRSLDQPVRPFANLPPLPDDLADAVERLKLVLLRHKADSWRDFACADFCAVLEAMKELALAPSDS